MIALLKVEEDVDTLAFFFGRLASQYKEEIEYKASLIEQRH
jgi:hypothetical protein